MVFIKVKGIKKPKFKGLRRELATIREKRSPEARIAKVQQRKKLVQAKIGLQKERLSLQRQKKKLRGLQLRSTGINAPKFARGTEGLTQFAFGGEKKKKGKAFDPFSQF